MKKSNKQDFIKKSNIIHNNKYDYSLVDYINSRTRLKIICFQHGVFEQRPDSHLNGSGCPICLNNKKSKSNDVFINQLKNIYKNNELDFSLIKYKNTITKVKIICHEHGIFEQFPRHILIGKGCPKCNKMNADIKQRKPKNKLLKEFKQIHGDIYDYSLIKYINTYTKVKIICKEHGIFEQLPREHLKGQGCPKCNNSKGEQQIEIYLINKKIKYKSQKIFNDCKYKKKLKFDFYLSEHNACIEYDGLQHYKPIKFFGGEKEFNNIKIRDQIKIDYCKENNIKLIKIKYNDNINESLDELLK